MLLILHLIIFMYPQMDYISLLPFDVIYAHPIKSMWLICRNKPCVPEHGLWLNRNNLLQPNIYTLNSSGHYQLQVTETPIKPANQNQEIIDSPHGKVQRYCFRHWPYPAALTISENSFWEFLALPFPVGFISRWDCPKQWQTQPLAALVLHPAST